jgi:hypothetical protein
VTTTDTKAINYTPPTRGEAQEKVTNGAVDHSISPLDTYDRNRSNAKEARRAKFLAGAEHGDKDDKPGATEETEEGTSDEEEGVEAAGADEAEGDADEKGEEASGKDGKDAKPKGEIAEARTADKEVRKLRRENRELKAQISSKPGTAPALDVDKVRAFAAEDPAGFVEFFHLDPEKYNAAKKAGKKADQAAIEKRLGEFIKAEPDKEKETIRSEFQKLQAKVADQEGMRSIGEHITKGLDGDADTWALCKAYGTEATTKVKTEVEKFVRSQIDKGRISSAADLSDEDAAAIISKMADKVEGQYEKLVDIGAKAKGLDKKKEESKATSSGYRGTYRKAVRQEAKEVPFSQRAQSRKQRFIQTGRV